jgi:hypothetical protein
LQTRDTAVHCEVLPELRESRVRRNLFRGGTKIEQTEILLVTQMVGLSCNFRTKHVQRKRTRHPVPGAIDDQGVMYHGSEQFAAGGRKGRQRRGQG